MKHNILDIKGLKVGQAQNTEAKTGVTVVIAEKGAVCGVDVRGAAPGTRETDLLNPINAMERVQAVVLSGGSAFGLEAASGVMDYLEEKGIGFDVGVTKVPIVPSAVLFDLGYGDAFVRPDKAMGRAACEAASDEILMEGDYGAGCGATVGKLNGMEHCCNSGIGSWAETTENGITVAALIAVNAFGDVWENGKIIAGTKNPDGTFANTEEGVIKAARKYSFLKYGASRNKIIALQNSFHGRTMAALSATGQDAYHNFFFPFVDGFVFAKANDFADILSKMTDDVCAVMLETVQGEGGVVPLDKEYVQAVAKACKEKDILLIVDEVQTGMGRTGSLFSYQQFGIQPDLVSCAKGLGGGLPIGAVLFGEKTETVFVPGDHGSTFGGNPVVCAGAVHILNTMDEAFLQDVQKKGAYLKEKIEKMPHVENVAGLGMMLGIQLDVEAKPVINALLEAGLLVLSAKTKIRLLPPLTITQEELDKGLTILEQTLASL